MARISNEVDVIENAPKLATDEDHREPFQSPVTFETTESLTLSCRHVSVVRRTPCGEEDHGRDTVRKERKDLAALEGSDEDMPALYLPDDDLSQPMRGLCWIRFGKTVPTWGTLAGL